MGKSPFWPCYHFEIHQTFPMEVHSRHSSIGHVNMNHKHPLVKKKNGKIINYQGENKFLDAWLFNLWYGVYGMREANFNYKLKQKHFIDVKPQ